MFVVFLLAVYLALGRETSPLDRVVLALGMTGFRVRIPGSGHTWFITALIFCYFATPLIAWFSDWADERGKRFLPVLVAAIFPAAMALIPTSTAPKLFGPIGFYMLAYLWGRSYEKMKRSCSRLLLAFALMLCSFGVRLLLWRFLDGTVFYQNVVIPYTHTIAAACIFYEFAYVFANRKPSKPVEWIGMVSFEVYLYHFIFADVPLLLFGVTGNWYLDAVLVTLVTAAVAIPMYFAAKGIYRLTKSKT